MSSSSSSENELPDNEKLGSSPTGDSAIKKILLELSNTKEGREVIANLQKGMEEKDFPEVKSKGSGRSPYYTRQFANLLLPVVDRLIETKRGVRFPYVRYPYLKNTLYNRILQSFHYIVDHMDTPDKKYFNVFVSTVISRSHDANALCILYKAENKGAVKSFEEPLVFDDMEASNKEEILEIRNVWKEKMEEFLMTANVGESVKVTGMSLTKEEVMEQEIQLDGIKDKFEFVVKKEFILLHRIR